MKWVKVVIREKSNVISSHGATCTLSWKKKLRTVVMTSQAELDECYKVAVQLARRAGGIANDALHKDKCVTTKASTSDLVTETDKKVEQLVHSELKQKFPTHCFIGEESVADGALCELTNDPTWMVDPIDGTTNFVHRFPFSCVSIGLAVNKESVMGVIYNFNLDQLFAAKKGSGATMNGKPIHVSQCTDLNQAMLLTDFGGYRPESVLRPKMEVLYELGVEPHPVHGIRCLGSAALALCMVACGSADGSFQYNLGCWDIAAGDIIVREAGGTTQSPNGDPLDLMKGNILCTGTKELATKMLPHVNVSKLCQ